MMLRTTGLTALVLLVAACAGCEPVYSPLVDVDALETTQRVIVLPFADAPGTTGGQQAGMAARGVTLTELMRAGDFTVVNVSPERLKEALDATGYAAEDCYDPVVAAAVGKELEVDAVVCGELMQYGTIQEVSSTAVMIVAGSETKTTHWVSISVRIVRSSDGNIIYAGSGTSSSPEGYTPAVSEACKQALTELKSVMARRK
jgi:curli biogenesis system outer membrane secretion channel CsgG